MFLVSNRQKQTLVKLVNKVVLTAYTNCLSLERLLQIWNEKESFEYGTVEQLHCKVNFELWKLQIKHVKRHVLLNVIFACLTFLHKAIQSNILEIDLILLFFLL